MLVIVFAVNVWIFLVSNIVVDSPHKIFVGGLPTYLNDEQVGILSLHCTLVCDWFWCSLTIVSAVDRFDRWNRPLPYRANRGRRYSLSSLPFLPSPSGASLFSRLFSPLLSSFRSFAAPFPVPISAISILYSEQIYQSSIYFEGKARQNFSCF